MSEQKTDTKGNLLQREPVRVWAAVQGVVMAIVNLVVLFGWDATAEQLAGINLVLTAIGVLVGSLWVRNQVTPYPPVTPPATT